MIKRFFDDVLKKKVPSNEWLKRYLIIQFSDQSVLTFMIISLIFICVSCSTKVLRPPAFFSEKTEMVSAALDNKSFKWENRITMNLNVHYLPDKWIPDRLDSVLTQMELFYKRNALILGDSTYDKRIDVFLVGPKSDVGIISGQPVTAIALLPERATVHSNIKLSTRPEILQHELMHVLSFDIWGIPQDFFMAEGLATSAYGTAIYGIHFDPILNYLLQNNKLPSLKQVVNSFFTYDEVITHYSGASFVKFIERKYGIEGVKILWIEGIERGSIRLNTNIKQLNKEWQESLKKSLPITKLDWERLQNP